jgi:hypothetical protein
VYRRRNVIARYFSSVPILRRIQGRPWVVRVKPNHPEWVHKCAHILVSVLPDPTHGDTLGTHPVPHPQPENSRGALPLLQYHHDVQLPLSGPVHVCGSPKCPYPTHASTPRGRPFFTRLRRAVHSAVRQVNSNSTNASKSRGPRIDHSNV